MFRCFKNIVLFCEAYFTTQPKLNVSEIEKVANHFGRLLTSDEVCSEKTMSMPKNKCRNRHEKYWF